MVEPKVGTAGECSVIPYDDWALPMREEARAAYISTTSVLAELAASRGDHDAAIRYRLRVLELDPYDERAHLGLVAAFSESGSHGEARRAYRVYIDRMGRIGVEPAPFAAPTTPAESPYY